MARSLRAEGVDCSAWRPGGPPVGKACSVCPLESSERSGAVGWDRLRWCGFRIARSGQVASTPRSPAFAMVADVSGHVALPASWRCWLAPPSCGGWLLKLWPETLANVSSTLPRSDAACGGERSCVLAVGTPSIIIFGGVVTRQSFRWPYLLGPPPNVAFIKSYRSAQRAADRLRARRAARPVTRSLYIASTAASPRRPRGPQNRRGCDVATISICASAAHAPHQHASLLSPLRPTRACSATGTAH